MELLELGFVIFVAGVKAGQKAKMRITSITKTLRDSRTYMNKIRSSFLSQIWFQIVNITCPDEIGLMSHECLMIFENTFEFVHRRLEIEL
jgi:hypothetical protein